MSYYEAVPWSAVLSRIAFIAFKLPSDRFMWHFLPWKTNHLCYLMASFQRAMDPRIIQPLSEIYPTRKVTSGAALLKNHLSARDVPCTGTLSYYSPSALVADAIAK